MFEITIKNLENNEVTEYKADGFCLMTMDEKDDGCENQLDMREICIEKIANAIAVSGVMSAAARLGVAKRDAAKDVGEEEGRRKMKGIAEALKKLAEEE